MHQINRIKFLCTGIVALFYTVHLFSQETQVTQDPAAAQVLDRVAAKTRSLQSMQTDFDLAIEDRKEKTKNSSTGNLILKQNKYKLTSGGSTVYYNGTTMWTYISANNEVTITEPKDNSGDFMSNPAAFFTSYKNDFKYRYVKQSTVNGIMCHEIDLFPKNLNQPYSRVKVFINAKTDLPVSIKSVGKDGVDYTVVLKNVLLDREITDAYFTFDPAKFKKIEIVDMRGM